MLSVQVKIGLRDGIRVEGAIGTPRRETLRAARWFVNAAVDHHLSDMYVPRLQLARHALHQSGQT